MFPIDAIWHKAIRKSHPSGHSEVSSEEIPVKILAFGQETTGDVSIVVAVILEAGYLRTVELKQLSGVNL